MMGQTTALIVLCLGSALGWAVLRASPRLRILAPPLLGVALGLAPQFAFLVAAQFGGSELVHNPAYAASAIVYDHAAVWMREHLAVVKESGGIFAFAIVVPAVGALALSRPILFSLPMGALRLIGAAAFIASIATTFTLATGNPAWEPLSDAQLRAELRKAMHNVVALNLKKEMTAEPPLLDAEELNRFIEFLKTHIQSLPHDPCLEPRPAASAGNAASAAVAPCRPDRYYLNEQRSRRRVLASVLKQAVEEIARSTASGFPDARGESASDSYTALTALEAQKRPTDQRAERARQVVVLLAARAIDVSFGSTPLAANLANAYFEIAEDEVAEALVDYLPLEAMLRVADNFSAVAQRMVTSARTQLLRKLIEPAIAPDAEERFARARERVVKPVPPEKDHDRIHDIRERAAAPSMDFRL